MKKNVIIFITICMFLITGCTTVPTNDIQIDSEVDPKAKFSGYKSYAWLGSAGIINDPDGKWKAPNFNVGNEIQFLVDRELRKRGMSETSSKPDMLVAYALGVDMAAFKLKENTETKSAILENVPKGALLVLLVDPQTEQVIWIGRATADVQKNPEMETVKKRLDYAITQMMKQIPK